MSIKDLCTQNVVFCEKNSILKKAAQTMKKHNVGTLVVVEIVGSKKPCGILTDRDIVLGVAADNFGLTTRVEDVMTNDMVTVPASEGIAETIRLMEKEGVRRVIVVDKSHNIVGIVSTDDIVQLVAQEMNGLGNVFQKQLKKSGGSKVLHQAFSP